MLKRFSEHGVINPAKCQFGVSQLKFLSHLVDHHGIRPLEEKVQALLDFPHPLSKCKLREFLGLVNFYRFLPGCAHILHPLNGLLSTASDHEELHWDDDAVAAFAAIKEALAKAALLTHPQPGAPLCLVMDASDRAVGAVLQQSLNGVWQPISFFSKKLKPAESHYSTFDRELCLPAQIVPLLDRSVTSITSCNLHLMFVTSGALITLWRMPCLK